MKEKHCWLVKQEPEDYSWTDFERDGVTAWTGVRSFQARNNLRAMAVGDLVLFYHSGKERAVVGIAKVRKVAYPDPTAEEGDWVSVDLVPVEALSRAVELSKIKARKNLQNIALVRQSRLSVMPLTAGEFRDLVALGQAKSAG